MYDGPFDYTDGPFSGQCHLTIVSSPRGERPTTFLTEINHPGGRTVTNAIEAIATQVVHAFGLDPQQIDFIQPLPHEGYFSVHFRWQADPEGKMVATEPEWQPFTPKGNIPPVS